MYLTAQRVQSPLSGEEGVNAFHYSHGGLDSLVLPEQNLGELRSKRIVIPPAGNRVRSYFDVIAPDSTSNHQITEELRQLVGMSEGLGPFPWAREVDRCLFRFGLEQALLPQWNLELAELFRAALLVRQSF